MQITKANQTTI